MLYCEYRAPLVAASEGLNHGFFTGKFSDSGKLYQQQEYIDWTGELLENNLTSGPRVIIWKNKEN